MTQDDNPILEHIKDIPDFDKLDHAQSAAKIIFALIPGGGVIIELINKSVSTYTNSNMRSYQEYVVKGFEDIYQKIDDLPRRMKEDKRFAAAYTQGFLIAIHTFQEEKIKILSNAVINSVLPGAPDENLQQIFLSLVDYFTPLHMSLLKVYYDANIQQRKNRVEKPGTVQLISTELEIILRDRFSEYVDKEFIFSHAAKELLDRGLVEQHKEEARMSGLEYTRERIWPPNITELGKQFIEFITPAFKNRWKEPPQVGYQGKVGEILIEEKDHIIYRIKDVIITSDKTPLGKDLLIALPKQAPVELEANLDMICYQPENFDEIIYHSEVVFLDNLKNYKGKPDPKFPIRVQGGISFVP